MIISPKTDINLRTENQDVFGHFDTPYGSLLVVCDGMGGARAGHAAADYTTNRFPQLLVEAYRKKLSAHEALYEAVGEINLRVHELGTSGDPEYTGMGTTLVFALEEEDGFCIGHVGDSRAYHVRDGKLIPLTNDHAPVAEMVARGILTDEQARNHPRRSLLSRAIGSSQQNPLELYPQVVRLAPGESLLLCSDGLCGFVSDEVIGETLSSLDDQSQAAEALVNLAKNMGSDDNITVLLAHEDDVVPDPIPIPVRPQASASDQPKTRPYPGKPPRAARESVSPRGVPPRDTPVTPRRSQPVKTTYVSYRRTQLLLLLAIFLMFCGGTFLHFKNFYHLTAYSWDQGEIVTENDEATEIEYLSEYDTTPEDCPISMAEQAKRMLGEFELELRKQSAISDEQEMILGARYATEFENLYAGQVDTDARWTNYLRDVGDLLTAHVKRKGITYQFHYVDDGMANAFSLPGGHIYIFRGLLETAIENEAQLAFAMAHEIMHVDKRHSIAFERVLRRLPDDLKAHTDIVRYFVNQPFSMNREEEADFEALRMIMQEGYSPMQAAPFLSVLLNADQYQTGNTMGDILAGEINDLFNTHPNPQRRVCQVRNQAIYLMRQVEGVPFYVGTSNVRERLPKSEIMF